MPRGRFGSRPVRIPSLAENGLYRFHTEALGLPFDVRGSEARQAFYQFGCEHNETHRADFDIAAFYEFVDHELLTVQLDSQLLPRDHIDGVATVLRWMYPRGLGLPQMQRASDVLADTYLIPIEQLLLLRNQRFARFADDFRIGCQSFQDAVTVLGELDHAIRGLGLTSSANKSGVFSCEELDRRDQQYRRQLNHYFEQSQEELTEILWAESDYGDEGEEFVIEPQAREVARHSMQRILTQWFDARGQEEPRTAQEGEEVDFYHRMIPSALGMLRNHDERVPEDQLVEVPFDRPARLELICRYVRNRPDSEAAEDWSLLDRLASGPRQSSWARIWLSDTGSHLSTIESRHRDHVMDWAVESLKDDHELVRAEACWLLACHGEGNAVDWELMLTESTILTRPGIGAAAAKAGLGEGDRIVKAAKQASPLVEAGYSWGTSNP